MIRVARHSSSHRPGRASPLWAPARRCATLCCAAVVLTAMRCADEPLGPTARAKILWFHQDSAGAAARPFADGELAVFTTEFDLRVVALDMKSGAPRWERRLPTTPGAPYEGMPHANIVAAGALLIVPAWDLFALDRNSGEIRWEFERTDDYPGWGDVAVADGRVFAAGKYLYAIDASTGSLLWRLDVGELPLAEQPWRPVVIDGTVYLSTRPGEKGSGEAHAMAVEAATGTVLWRYSISDTDPGKSGSVGPPFIRDTVLVVACYNRKVYALDRRTGQLLWTYTGANNAYMAGAVIIDSTVVTGADAVEGLDIATGRLRWRSGPIGTVTVPITMGEEGHTALVSSAVVYAYDATGKIQWRYGGERWGQPVYTTAATYRDSVVYVGSVAPEPPGPGFYAIRLR